MGATLKYFSPLVDAALPECDAVWLPGGYPELHGAALAANRPLWQSLSARVEAGQPVLAECGGMMALFETLGDVEGNEHRLAGLLPGQVRMQKRLAGLGMQEVELPEGTLRGPRLPLFEDRDGAGTDRDVDCVPTGGPAKRSIAANG